jgi:hypothetical protein
MLCKPTLEMESSGWRVDAVSLESVESERDRLGESMTVELARCGDCLDSLVRVLRVEYDPTRLH